MPQPQTMREKINQIIDEEFFSKDDGENGQRALGRLLDLYTSQVQEAEERGFDSGERSLAKAILRREHIYPNDPEQTWKHILLMCKSIVLPTNPK